MEEIKELAVVEQVGIEKLKSPVTPFTASPLDGYPSAPNRITVTATGAIPITVGAGGAGGTASGSTCNVGTASADGSANSTFSTITGAGGGTGGGMSPNGPGPNSGLHGKPGGSGGGGFAGRVLPQHLFLQQQQLELEMILQQLLLKDFQVVHFKNFSCSNSGQCWWWWWRS